MSLSVSLFILAIACLATQVSVSCVLLINPYQDILLGLGYHVQDVQTVSSLLLGSSLMVVFWLLGRYLRMTFLSLL